MRCSMPRIHAGRALGLAGQVAGREHDRRRTVGDGRDVGVAERHVGDGLGEQHVGARVAPGDRVRVRERGLPVARRDLRELALVRDVGRDRRARLQRREVDGRRPERRHRVRVVHEVEDLVDVAERRLPEPVDQRRVDVADLDGDPRLVERPRGVHLDVALLDRRPRPHRVEPLDERERTAGEVVARARHGEPDVVARDPRLRDRVTHDRDDELDLVALPVVVRDVLREPDDRDVSQAHAYSR